MKKIISRILWVTAVVLPGIAEAEAYSIRIISGQEGGRDAMCINNLGQVAGRSGPLAFIWTPEGEGEGSSRVVGDIGWGSEVTGLSETGVICGFRYTDAGYKAAFVGGLNGIEDLIPLPGYESSEATGISSEGLVVGACWNGGWWGTWSDYGDNDMVGVTWDPVTKAPAAFPFYADCGESTRIAAISGSGLAVAEVKNYRWCESEDGYEDNNLQGMAWPLNQSEAAWLSGQWLSDRKGEAAQFDDDWFALGSLAQGQRVRVDTRLDFSELDGDFGVDLYNAAGVRVAWSVRAGEGAALLHTVSAAGAYYVHVWGSGYGTGYDLRWTASSNADDSYEDNDDAAQAAPLPRGVWLHGIQQDEDWFAIDVLQGQTRLQVECLFVSALSDIDIGIYADGASDPSVDDPIAYSASMADREFIDYCVSAAGRYFVRVLFYSDDNFTGAEYDLRWTAPACADDAFEENDTKEAAYDFTAAPNTWLSSLSGKAALLDDDWYAIAVPADAGLLTIDCRVDNGGGYPLAELYRAGETQPVGNSVVLYSGGKFIFSVEGPGIYHLGVFATDYNWGNHYDLRWTTGPEQDDPYEENEWFDSAFPLTQPEVWLHGVQFDEDWYAITVPDSAPRVRVQCNFERNSDDLFVTLTDENGDGVGWASSTPDGAALMICVPQAGTYYIRIEGSGIGKEYDLLWNTEPCDDDLYEPNNTLETAFSLVAYENMWLENINGLGIQGDDDWFEIAVPDGAELLTVEVTFDTILGDIDVELYDSAGEWITASAGVQAGESLGWCVTAPGIYYVHLYCWIGGGNSYNLRWYSGPRPPAITDGVDDVYEPNDGLFDASLALQGHSGTWLSELAGQAYPAILIDEDWYEITVPSDALRVAAECRASDPCQEIWMDLYDATWGDTVAWSWFPGGKAMLEVCLQAPGTYYLRIYTPGSPQAYDLRWGTLPCLGQPQGGGAPHSGDDAYEENDTRDTATNLGDTPNTWLTDIKGKAKQFDDDWYSIRVTAGNERVTVDCTFLQSGGDIDVELINGLTGEAIARSESWDDNENIDTCVSGAGTYYVRVYYSNLGNTYDLRWNAMPCTDVLPSLKMGSALLWNAYQGDLPSDTGLAAEAYGENGALLRSMEIAGINDAGMIAGTAITPEKGARSFVWETSQGLRILDTLDNLSCRPQDINNQGKIVGNLSVGESASQPFFWSAALGMTYLESLHSPDDPNPWPKQLFVRDINDSGQIVGTSDRGQVFVLSTSPPRSELFVSPSGSDSAGNGSLAAPWASIDLAMRLAGLSATPANKVTIHLGPGIYDEPVTLRPNVILEGADADAPAATTIQYYNSADANHTVLTGAEGACIRNVLITVPGVYPSEMTLLHIEDVSMCVDNVVFDGRYNQNSTALLVYGTGSSSGSVRHCVFQQLNDAVWAVDSGIDISYNLFDLILNNAIFVKLPTGKNAKEAATPVLGIQGEDSGHNTFGQVEGHYVFNATPNVTMAEVNDWGVYVSTEIGDKMSENVDYVPFLAKTGIISSELLCLVQNDITKAPIPSAVVGLSPGSLGRSATDDQGLSLFPGLGGGDYVVSAEASGFIKLVMPVTLAPGELKAITISLKSEVKSGEGESPSEEGEGEGEGEGEAPPPDKVFAFLGCGADTANSGPAYAEWMTMGICALVLVTCRARLRGRSR